MISKPPPSGKSEIDTWNQELRFEVNNDVQIIDVPVSKSAILNNYAKGKHAARLCNAANDAGYFEFIVPPSLKDFKEVTIRFIPTTSGTFNYTVNMAYGAVGAAHNATTKTTSVTGATATDGKIMEMSITSLFTDQVPNDQVGVEFVLDALSTTTEINLLSLFVKYI